MVSVTKMKATSTTSTKSAISPPSKQRKRKKLCKAGSGGATRSSERETGFRLSQEFPNSNWLERKINSEIKAFKDRKKERRYDEDDEDKLLVVDDGADKEAHPCIAISEDDDGMGIQVSVLGIGSATESSYIEI